MKTPDFLQKAALLILLIVFISSCIREEDPGPLQNDERNFALTEFDRLDMGEAFIVTVQQSPVYSIRVTGDRRNLDDLAVVKIGSTLNARYTDNREHEHTTYITITMPSIAGANFSGASNVTISGFKDMANMELILSGASMAQLNIESKQSVINLSGASRLTMSGKSDVMIVKASGASELYAYALTADKADVDASGASKINVYAVQSLKANASGAGIIYYKGNPTVDVVVSGAGVVQKD
jgi:Putative auto-transporter adhesin, head GIN domain